MTQRRATAGACPNRVNNDRSRPLVTIPLYPQLLTICCFAVNVETGHKRKSSL